MHGQYGRVQVGEGLYVSVGIDNHQMHVKWLCRMASNGLEHRHSEAYVGHEYAVHDVDVMPCGLAPFDHFDVALEVSEISGQKGWSNDVGHGVWVVAKIFQICIVKRSSTFSFGPTPVIGLTGGIGAGKSTVASVFKSFGISVFSADDVAKQCYVDDKNLRETVISRFGSQVYPNGAFDSRALAERVFGAGSAGDDAALEDLNAMVHPAVAQAFDLWHVQQAGPYVLREAAILFESGSDSRCDAVIVVTASEPVRLRRAASRDSSSIAQVKARMDKQWPATRLMERADHLIDSGGRLPLIPQVAEIHALLLSRY